MIRLVPSAESPTGRILNGLGKLFGLRSETVYSRAITLLALCQFIVLGFAVVLVWLSVTDKFHQAEQRDLVLAAERAKDFLDQRTNTLPQLLVPAMATLSGRQVEWRSSASGLPRDGVRIEKTDGKDAAVFAVATPEGHVLGEIVVAGKSSLFEAGALAVRIFVVGLAVAGGLMLLIMLLVVDRTIVGRIQLLADKLENEKKSERLPVRLDVPGDDEIAQLAGSIEELARLVQAAEREYRNVVEDQIESICRFDVSGRISFYNRGFELLCVRPPSGSHPPLDSCIDPSMHSLVLGNLTQLRPDHPVTAFTHVVKREGEPPTWYRSTLRANFNEHGVHSGGQWIASDVTGDVQAQRRLQDSQEQLQVLSARLMSLQDEERRRIARDLHDSTAQALSVLEMNTSLLESRATDDQTRRLAADTAAISRQVCQELRNISYLLHPPLLEERGLSFAIRWFAEGFTKRNEIPVFLDLPEDFPRLPSEQETALFRIVQESLSNIYRHAGATKAWITLRRAEDGAISLEVRDNGEGLPKGFSFDTSVGVGLAGMRERMKQLRGTLELDSSAYGVSLKCRIGATDRAGKLAAD